MQLSAPDTHEEALADPDFFSKYENLKKQVQGKMEEWEGAQEELDEKK